MWKYLENDPELFTLFLLMIPPQEQDELPTQARWTARLWFANGWDPQVKLMNIMKVHIFPAIHSISNGSNYFQFLVTASTTYESLKIADSFLCCISLTEERGHIIIWRGLTMVGGYIQLLLVYLIGTLYSINRWNCSHAFLWIQIYYYQECQTN